MNEWINEWMNNCNKRMNEITDSYWKKMIEVTKKLGYKNPEDNGCIRKKIVINENICFKLYDKDKSINTTYVYVAKIKVSMLLSKWNNSFWKC